MWFWRGTQSAIFYYASLAPCMEYNHKRKRRKEASRAGKKRDELELSQPGIISQPAPFQTNKYWLEEIAAGPGPPRGWRRDSIHGDAKRNSSGQKDAQKSQTINGKKSVFATPVVTTDSAKPTPGADGAKHPQRPVKQLTDQHPSTLDNLRDTLRSSLSPENWNLKRYEREDEPLWGLNDTISRMWERATTRQGSTSRAPSEHRRSLSRGRKRATTMESEQYDFYRARNPEINDMHPPVVSQLPATQAEVAWMLQPPPSRAVMEGKVRPGAESILRRSLCRIESTEEEESRRERRKSEAFGSLKEETEEKTWMKPDRRKEDAPVITISRDENAQEGAAYSSDDDETPTPPSAKVPRATSLPQNSAAVGTRSASSASMRNSWLPQRPPLATIATTSTTTTSMRSFVLPTSSPKLNSRSSSPAPDALVRKIESRQGPPEWDYLLEVCLPQMPARTRSSLPTRLGEAW